ncbi:MAG TPA: oligosaccharide flippase family protein [Pyrinomonadaceae bacterium]|jgi:O-antigen/teichoic acid export membrane protein
MNVENEKKDSLKKQGAWLMFAKTVGFVFSFLLPLLVVRLLDQRQVGVYRQSFQFIVNVIAILPLGFSMSAYYFLNREIEKRGAAIFNILLFNFVVGGLACLGLFLYPQFLGNIFQSQEMTRLAPSVGVVIWIWIFSIFLEIVAVANREARLATAFIIFAQFSKTLLMASAVLFFTTVDAFLYAAMIQGVLQTVILLFYLNSRFPHFWGRFDFAFFREQLVYAVPFGLAGILWTLQTDIHNYFVGYRFSEADYAIYAFGCFQFPLVRMLAESVNSVLIPRMTELEAEDNRAEMIRLTARAMQKLAFFYFPLYAFLLVTANTFVLTLFTHNYMASVPIFVINLTLLPIQILVTDPVVRAYKELGRFLLVLRIFIFIALVAALYFGIWHFNLSGMIAIVVVVSIIEKLISETAVIRKLGVGSKDLPLLKNVGVTAFISAAAGIATYLVYSNVKDAVFYYGEKLASALFAAPKESVTDFIGGGLTLFISGAVFGAIYLAGAFYFNVIEDGEKTLIKSFIIRPLSFAKKKIASQKASDHRPLTTNH